MTDLRKAAKEALWAFQCHVEQTWPTDRSTAAIAALRAALAQQDEPQRKLTDDQIGRIWFEVGVPGLPESGARRLIRAAEAEWNK